MKETGIVRRIDELGRIVIPKEIRKNLRINEGDLVEIFVDEKESVVLRKHTPFKLMEEDSFHLAKTLFDFHKNTHSLDNASTRLKHPHHLFHQIPLLDKKESFVQQSKHFFHYTEFQVAPLISRLHDFLTIFLSH